MNIDSIAQTVERYLSSIIPILLNFFVFIYLSFSIFKIKIDISTFIQSSKISDIINMIYGATIELLPNILSAVKPESITTENLLSVILAISSALIYVFASIFVLAYLLSVAIVHIGSLASKILNWALDILIRRFIYIFDCFISDNVIWILNNDFNHGQLSDKILLVKEYLSDNLKKNSNEFIFNSIRRNVKIKHPDTYADILSRKNSFFAKLVILNNIFSFYILYSLLFIILTLTGTSNAMHLLLLQIFVFSLSFATYIILVLLAKMKNYSYQIELVDEFLYLRGSQDILD